MTCCGAFTPETLPSHRSAEEQALLDASTSLSGGMVRTEFILPHMHCAGCIAKIENGLAGLDFVDSVRANLSHRLVTVIWSKEHGSALRLDETITKLGFDHHISEGADAGNTAIEAEGRRLLLSLAVAGFAATNIMLLSISVWSGADAETAQLFHLISGLIAVPAIVFAGRPFFSSALRALSVRRLNMDVPISLAVVLALLLSLYETIAGHGDVYFDAGVTLLFFLLIGRTLDHFMRRRARSAVSSLVRMSARGGLQIKPDGTLSHIRTEDIVSGMVLRILPGERFPVDATVQSGISDVDRSLVTGESEALTAGTDDVFEAGTLNLTGPLDVVAKTDRQGSYLTEMVEMMKAAESGRGRYVQLAERMAGIYAPAVHLLAFATFILWFAITRDWSPSITNAVAVLIVTCPCALGLAVPVVQVVAANRLFQNGILIRDGSALERLAQIDCVAFDKTGTLTTGAPHVISFDRLDNREEAILSALAAASRHPVAQAISREVGAARSQHSSVSVHHVREIPGSGMEGFVDGKKARLGKAEWVGEISHGGVDADASSIFAIQDAPARAFHLSDELRHDASNAIKACKASGLETAILSGDRTGEVEAIAQTVGISHAFARLTPRGKIDLLESWKQADKHVFMVGDGLNDAPALAASHVSMSPATASEASRLAADFVFTRPSLNAVPAAHKIARQAVTLIKQNFAIAIAYNCVAVPLAMMGQVTPLVAAIAMSASSILVVVNSLRLSRSDQTARSYEGTAEGQAAFSPGKAVRHPPIGSPLQEGQVQ